MLLSFLLTLSFCVFLFSAVYGVNLRTDCDTQNHGEHAISAVLSNDHEDGNVHSAIISPTSSFTVRAAQFTMNCQSKTSCFTITSTCPSVSNDTQTSNCFFDAYFTAGAGWKVDVSVTQNSGISKYYQSWGTVANPINIPNTVGPFNVQPIQSFNNCMSSLDTNIFFRVYCFQASCQVSFTFSISWSCGIKWVTNPAFTPCDINCQKTNTVSCQYSTPKTATVDNSVCQAAVGSPTYQRYLCKDGDSCATNYGTCYSGVCAPPTRSPTLSPTTLAPTVFISSSWQCVPGESGIDSWCNQGACLPGINDILGFGYDTTRSSGKHFAPNRAAIRRRIYAYRDLNEAYSLRDKIFFKPNSNQVQASTGSYTQMQIDSYTIQSVEELSLRVAAELKIDYGQETKKYLKGLGIGASVTKEITNSVATGKTFIEAFAKTSELYLKLQASASSPLLCSSTLQSDLNNLERNPYPSQYYQFVSNYGTHIIVEAAIGGHLRYSTQVDTCSFTTTDELSVAGSAYTKMMEGMITTGRRSSAYYSTVVTRSSAEVCGGKSQLYFGSNDSSSWTAWTQSIYDSPQGNCGFDFGLVPIPVLARNLRMQMGLEQAVFRYINASIASAQIKTNTKSTCQVSGSGSNARLPILSLITSLILICYSGMIF